MPKEWADKYKGKFDDGWDKLREETFARQKKLGVIPADCELTARHAEIPSWDDTPEEFKPVLSPRDGSLCRLHGVHRPPCGPACREHGEAGHPRNTLIYYIIGDNGASAEGGINGCFNEMSYFNRLQALETPEYLNERLDKLGGPKSYNHYAVGWAHAMNTPYQWTKQVASHLGGTRNGTDRALAQGHQGQGRNPVPVLTCDRRRPDHPRSGRHSRAG